MAFHSTNVAHKTTRVKITVGGAQPMFAVYERGELTGCGHDVRFVPEHIRHEVEMRLLSPLDGMLWNEVSP